MRDDASGLEARVLQTLRAQGLVRPGNRVLAAVSGGADSVALLLLLSAAREALGFTLEAAHYEHGIRGEASVADAAYVAGLCAEQDIPCHVGHGDVPALAAAWRCSLEDAARRARYTFLEETADATGAAWIALAHQQEDQAETLLLHLVHGCGLQGLGGMRPQNGRRIRPLLDISRMELEAYLRAQGIAWREDETNGDPHHARNLLRGEVFPVLRRLNPRVAEAMARTAALAAQAQDALAAAAEAQLSGRVRRMPYGLYWLADERALLPEAARLLARQCDIPPLDAKQTEAIVTLPRGGQANLPGGWHALRTARRLHLVRADWTPPPVNLADFTWTEASPQETGDGIRVQVLDADRLGSAAFRTRQDGDLFAPLGMQGTQKLKQTLRDAGIDRPFRDLLPVLADGNRVLWIVGLKAGRDAAIAPQTRRAMRIEYRGLLPEDGIEEQS